jgi:hypothetical protein
LASLGLQRSKKIIGNLIKHVGTCLFFEYFLYFPHSLLGPSQIAI